MRGINKSVKETDVTDLLYPYSTVIDLDDSRILLVD